MMKKRIVRAAQPTTWEDQWDPNGRQDPDDGGIAQGITEEPQTPDEERVSAQLWAHMRYLATRREAGNPAPYLAVTDPDTDPDYAPDTRAISPSHSTGGIVVEHRGSYWVVTVWSTEFSSSYQWTARAATLEEALRKVAEEAR